MPFFKKKWKVRPAFLLPSAGQESRIPSENREMLLQKYGLGKFLHSKPADFALKCHFLSSWRKLKEMNIFWCHNQNCAWIPTHSSEIFNTRMLLNIYFKTASPIPQKCLISPPNAILFLHGEAFTERGGRLLKVLSRLCIDCCRIIQGI